MTKELKRGSALSADIGQAVLLTHVDRWYSLAYCCFKIGVVAFP
jgi:hypothetical protein